MANATRILFISEEVAPFATVSEVAKLVRTLPEKLQESGDFEVRIMMPRYGTISERRNRLHEVIRLSGTVIEIGSQKETLKVKVASIPGIRLQVYFMDNNRYFKRKGIYADKQGKSFDDNVERALFFGNATLETISNLGWKPDVVHAFGAMSAFVPYLLRTRFASNEVFKDVRTIFTPNDEGPGDVFTAEKAAELDLSGMDAALDHTLESVGISFADLVVQPSGASTEIAGALQFADDEDACMEQALDLYDPVGAELAA